MEPKPCLRERRQVASVALGHPAELEGTTTGRGIGTVDGEEQQGLREPHRGEARAGIHLAILGQCWSRADLRHPYA